MSSLFACLYLSSLYRRYEGLIKMCHFFFCNFTVKLFLSWALCLVQRAVGSALEAHEQRSSEVSLPDGAELSEHGVVCWE